MWPALLQLIELAPHVKRLVPMADKYLQSKAETRESQRRAFDQMADGLRGDLGEIAGGVRGKLGELALAQAEISQQLHQQVETLAAVAAEIQAARLAATELEMRLGRIEARMQRMWILVWVGLGLAAISAVGVIALLVQLHGHS